MQRGPGLAWISRRKLRQIQPRPVPLRTSPMPPR